LSCPTWMSVNVGSWPVLRLGLWVVVGSPCGSRDGDEPLDRPEGGGRGRRWSASEQPGAPAGGWAKAAAHRPGLLRALDDLVEPTARGDPAAPLRWTAKSVRALHAELTRLGYRVSPSKVGQLLAGLGYSLQVPAKQNKGAQHPDRDAQFRYVNEAATAHLAAGQPVISVDTKKKEVVGNLANKGREWQPKGEPVRVDVHDFPDPKVGKAIPYGVYDVGANQGFVSVGADADTAAFAVATIGRWWDTVGSPAYPRRAGCSSPPTPGDPTDTAAGCGSGSLGALAARTGRRSPSATSRPAPASGTASSTACSATSP
jgi:hypothetical protein